jgi:hypothetical protein
MCFLERVVLFKTVALEYLTNNSMLLFEKEKHFLGSRFYLISNRNCEHPDPPPAKNHLVLLVLHSFLDVWCNSR